MAEVLRRKEIITAIPIIITIIMFVEYFFNVPGINTIAENLRTWAVVISNIALGLGVINLVRTHSRHVQRRTPDRWFFSICCLLSFVVVTIFGLISTSSQGYQWAFTYIYTPLGQTMYATTGFYIFSSAYRAFRARNVDAAMLLIAGCFVVLTNAPIGEVIWSGIPIIGTWIMENGQVPAYRIFTMTAGFGLLAYGFRVILGKERGFYGELRE
jgi:hypothetical protein